MAIRTLVDLFRAGANFTAEQVIRAGGAVRNVTQALRRRFGTELEASPSTIRTLSERARMSVEIGARLSAGQAVNPRDIPVNPGLGSDSTFSYRAIVESAIRTGQSESDIQRIRSAIRIPSGIALSNDEIRDIAEGMARNEGREIQSPPILRFAQQSGRIVSSQEVAVISAYRAPRAGL